MKLTMPEPPDQFQHHLQHSVLHSVMQHQLLSILATRTEHDSSQSSMFKYVKETQGRRTC